MSYAEDQAEIALIRYSHCCWLCGQYLHGTNSGRAHRIAQNKANVKKYGRSILDHNLNIYMSCNECNSYATKYKLDRDGERLQLNSGKISNRVSRLTAEDAAALIEEIKKDLTGSDK
jgi:hypothetical protein